jgi:hypothetical protein
LQDVGLLALIKARHDDVAALDEPQLARTGAAEPAAQHLIDPGAGGVDDHARPHRFGRLRSRLDLRLPEIPIRRC